METDVDDLTLQITEELDAFDPKWRDKYPNVRSAAKAAGVIALFNSWLKTEAGSRYIDSCGSLPDHVGQSRREAAALVKPTSLPYGYRNIGDAMTAMAFPEHGAEVENRFRPEESNE